MRTKWATVLGGTGLVACGALGGIVGVDAAHSMFGAAAFIPVIHTEPCVVGQSIFLDARTTAGTSLTGVTWRSTDSAVAPVFGDSVKCLNIGTTEIHGAHSTGIAAFRVAASAPPPPPPPPDTTPPDTTPPPPVPTSCIDVVSTWQSIAFASQSGSFVIELTATPGASPMDGVVGLSNGRAVSYSDLAVIARFYTAGRIEVRNGSNYVSTPVTYTVGTRYHFRFTVNLATRRYTATVRPEGGTETTLGTDLAFRTEQASVTVLSNVSTTAPSGTMNVCLTKVEATGTTPPPPPPTPTDTVVTPPPPLPPIPTGGAGIWLSAQEIAALPMSGTGWTSVKAEADKTCGTPNLSNQDDNANVCIMAKALVYARTGQTGYRDGVLVALRSIVNSGTYSGRALALGRELAAYVLAADIIGLAQVDPALDAQFRVKLDELRSTATSSGPANLNECQERRPNNWGTWCGFSRIVAALYLGDLITVTRAATVFRGWTGERAVYAGFVFGDLWWQSNPAAPVGINPRGAMIQGRNVDGVIPDDQRRCGAFQWPPCQTDYTWGALEGVLPTSLVLHRAGFTWALAAGDSAVVRAYRWLYDPARGNLPPTGNDTWQPYLVNWIYGTTYPQSTNPQPGKNIGWTQWTHRR